MGGETESKEAISLQIGELQPSRLEMFLLLSSQKVRTQRIRKEHFVCLEHVFMASGRENFVGNRLSLVLATANWSDGRLLCRRRIPPTQCPGSFPVGG